MVAVAATWRVRGIFVERARAALWSAVPARPLPRRTGSSGWGCRACSPSVHPSRWRSRTLHLRNAPHFRDYGKAPFALASPFRRMAVRGRFRPAGRRGWRGVRTRAGDRVRVSIGLARLHSLFLIALFGFVDGGLLRNLL